MQCNWVVMFDPACYIVFACLIECKRWIVVAYSELAHGSSSHPALCSTSLLLSHAASCLLYLGRVHLTGHCINALYISSHHTHLPLSFRPAPKSHNPLELLYSSAFTWQSPRTSLPGARFYRLLAAVTHMDYRFCMFPHTSMYPHMHTHTRTHTHAGTHKLT